ncbi:MAG: YfiR family protein [Terriglobia bacterium]
MVKSRQHLKQKSYTQSLARQVRRRAAALAVAWTLITVPASRTAASAATEYEVKAAYLLNFAKFVQWPVKAAAAQEDAFSICVVGADPFGPALDAIIEGETIGDKKVVARRISKPQDATACRILFISSSEDSELPGVLAALDDSSVLTVSDMPEFTRRGGMIHLILEDRRVRFEINLSAAERAGLTLSSQLLKLAVRVTRKPRPGAGAGD